MRRFRLNGWQRIGIVLSVVWVVVAGVWVMSTVEHLASTRLRSCLLDASFRYPAPRPQFYATGPPPEYEKEVARCEREFRNELNAYQAQYNRDRLYAVARIGLAPILAAWLLPYLLISLVRWIRRGFNS